MSAPGWRPRNETAEHLRIENEAKAFIAAAWKCEIIKLSETQYSLDWGLSRNGGLVAWGEFKQRGRAYDDYLLSGAKFERGLRLANTFDVPFLFFIGIGNRIIYADLRTAPVLRVEIAGNSRGQNGDIEPCVFFAASEFKPV